MIMKNLDYDYEENLIDVCIIIVVLSAAVLNRAQMIFTVMKMIVN